MRILHTSDWHLGRTFHGTSLHDLAGRVLDELIDLVTTEKIDVVLVSGDVYDQAQPRPETVRLLDSVFTRLTALGTQVIAISGNHDSAVRLGFGSSMLAASGLHLVTSPEQVGTPIEIEKDGARVGFYGIPYLEPRPTAELWGTEASHTAVLTEAMHRIQENAQGQDYAATVVLSHCFATGGEGSDSERDISVGGAISAPASIFSRATYTALGHLHGKQKITESVRYSGSLLAYSFSEKNHRKGAWIIDLDAQGKADTTEYHWKNHLALATLRGPLAEILSEDYQDRYRNAFLSITLTDPERPAQALEQLRAAYDNVHELYFEPVGVADRPTHSYRRTSTAQSPEAICDSFFTHVRDRALNEEEKTFLRSILEEVRLTGASA
ncbi:exonuclease SbcCD subunit D [Rothia nasimurium]|uniref:exonuclease SbcCD subunit D n=1 Tax=Rothia nasimurium TaxID=85336 RepID=UPI003B9F2F75